MSERHGGTCARAVLAPGMYVHYFTVCVESLIFSMAQITLFKILHIYILSSGVYYNILSTSGSYYNIEFVFL